MSGNESSTFAGHNYKADYKYKVTMGQKADGSVQLKEIRVQGDEWEPLVGLTFDILGNTYATGKKKHLKMVSPYENGHEPEL